VLPLGQPPMNGLWTWGRPGPAAEASLSSPSVAAFGEPGKKKKKKVLHERSAFAGIDAKGTKNGGSAPWGGPEGRTRFQGTTEGPNGRIKDMAKRRAPIAETPASHLIRPTFTVIGAGERKD